MSYQAILFDVSDTLVEYHPNWAEIYGDRLRALGFAITDQMACEIRRAVNWAIGAQSLNEMDGAPHATTDESARMKNEAALSCVHFPDGMKARYLEQMARMPKVKQEMRVIAGVIETLKILKTTYRLAIVSNHHAWLADRLRELQLNDFFHPVVISEVVGIEKPDVRIMEIALRELDLPAKRCLYVGDHPMDVLCAKKAGLDCALIVGDWEMAHLIGGYRADYHIENLRDLLEILPV